MVHMSEAVFVADNSFTGKLMALSGNLPSSMSVIELPRTRLFKLWPPLVRYTVGFCAACGDVKVVACVLGSAKVVLSSLPFTIFSEQSKPYATCILDSFPYM